jgi:flagellar basal body-associated protein FliL
MEKAIRNLILLVIVMALVTGGIYLFLNSRGVPGQEQNQGRGQEQGQEGEEAPPQEINFTESGNLIRNNPGMDPDDWPLMKRANAILRHRRKRTAAVSPMI